MGLSALRKVLAPEPVDLDHLSGSTVAVDANNLLWTFVTGMARGGQPEGPHGRPISHVIGLVNRLTLYGEVGLRSAWVFDGDPPELKAETIAEREKKREEAREAGKEVQATKLEPFQLEESIELLDALGVPWHRAPSETDAQLSHWVDEGLVDAAVTQDYDIALHGCPLTFRNVKRTGRRPPERMALDPVLEAEDLTRTQLVDAAILIGTDYNEGIHGVGPVTALKLVREHGDVWGALEAREADVPRAGPVRELFLEPEVDRKARPSFRDPDRERVRDLLDDHGLSRQRADRVVDAVSEN